MDIALQKTLAKQAEFVLNTTYYDHYVKKVHNGGYEHFRHTKLICEQLQRIADGEELSLMIEMPPRHGKSMTVTESFPSFYLAKNPEKRVIVSAYSDSLARKFGRLNRDKFKDFSPTNFGLELSHSNSAVKDWGIHEHAGGMISTGIGGSITGHGADLMIIDDPIKNAQEAMSQTIRENIWNEWESTLSTRLHAGASVIVVMTRWHEDDLIGKLLKTSGRSWIRLRLPAIAEDEDDLLGRNIGEALCPELGFDEKWAKLKKVDVGSRTWASLYQQHPTPEGGNIFKRSWVKYYVPSVEMKIKLRLGDDVKVMPSSFDIQLQSWDCTFKDKSTSDYVAGQVWGRLGVDHYLLDRHHERMGIVDTMKAIEVMTAKWPDAIAKLIEDKANGTAVIEMLTKKIKGLIPVNPQGGKEVRAQAVAPLWEAGNVYLPHPLWKPYTDEIMDELVAFPNADHDDDVDSMSQALVRLDNKPKRTRRENRKTAF